MKTMKAVCIYSHGGPEVLRYEEMPLPRPQTGEVLVRVHAAGINPVDWKIREGLLHDLLQHAFPLVLGWDVSGVVESLGPDTSRLRVGDEVYSKPDITRDGAYAEFIVIKESEVALKPASLDHVHAAALPLAGLTAWQALFETAGLTAGQRVLIHAAAGGVGNIAVQLAKWKGAHVIGTASSKNHDFLRKLGVDQAVDHEKERFEDVVAPVDVVLDTIGGDTQARSWKVLKPGGFLVSIVSPPSTELAAAHGVREKFIFTQANAGQLAEIARVVDAGKLKAYVETILPLSAAKRAQELSQRGHTCGKLVLLVN
jgi:NADPH:quinone reductase-like Zn-dependent oxidoreductase